MTPPRRAAALAALLCLGASAGGRAAEPSALRFGELLRLVGRSNLDLEAQRWSVPIAEAQVALARVFPDPQVLGGLGALDVSGQGQPTSVLVQLNVPLELGGKRGARVAAARADLSVAQLQLLEALRALRGVAATAYVDALRARLVLARKRKTLEGLEGLVRLNEQRLRAGDIGEIAVVQSRVEARHFASDVLAAQAELRAADLALLQLLGAARGRFPQDELSLSGDIKVPPRRFDAGRLLASAKDGRLDLRAQMLAGDAAAARVRLAQANRWIDVTLGVGWARNLATSAESFAQPTNDVLSATVTAPIPLSRIYRGELGGAVATRAQAQAQVRALEARVEIEIRQSLARYDAAAARVALYTQGILVDADRVLQSMLYNYQRGGATLLEVLSAQRTVDEVYLSYYDALAEHARGLVAVEQAAGIWDVDL